MWTSISPSPRLASYGKWSGTPYTDGSPRASSRSCRESGRSIGASYYREQKRRIPGDDSRRGFEGEELEGVSLARIILAAIAVDALAFGIPALMSAAHLAGWW